MARIRTIKPEFFRHEGLQDLESDNPGKCVMLVFAGLWGHCDKAGRFEWKPRMLKLDILPFLDFDMAETLDILWRLRFLLRYEFDGREYGEIASFEKHQRIGGKELQEPAKHPEPTEYKPLPNGEAMGKQSGSNGEATGIAGREGKGIGREEEGKGTDICRAATVRFPQVDEIFDFWRTTLGHERSLLDSKRRKLIESRLKDGYSESDLKAAIVGCSLSPFHMGQNENGRRYDGIDLIFRDGAKLDQFIQFSTNPPKPQQLNGKHQTIHDQRAATLAALTGKTKQNDLIDITGSAVRLD